MRQPRSLVSAHLDPVARLGQDDWRCTLMQWMVGGSDTVSRSSTRSTARLHPEVQGGGGYGQMTRVGRIHSRVLASSYSGHIPTRLGPVWHRSAF